jgi:hypothetical protein
VLSSTVRAFEEVQAFGGLRDFRDKLFRRIGFLLRRPSSTRCAWAPGSIGWPTTVVQAEDLSVPAILNGIPAGRTFVDLIASSHKVVDFDAELSGATFKARQRLEPSESRDSGLTVGSQTSCP